LVVAAVGVEFGWEPIKEGGNTYIVQVEPDLFLKGGVVARSYVPPELFDKSRSAWARARCRTKGRLFSRFLTTSPAIRQSPRG
jgi:hypothetical protein